MLTQRDILVQNQISTGWDKFSTYLQALFTHQNSPEIYLSYVLELQHTSIP